MSTITFDTLKFVKTLEASGIERKQAEAIAAAHKDASTDKDMVTKIDLQEIKHNLLQWITGLAFVQLLLLTAILMKMPH